MSAVMYADARDWKVQLNLAKPGHRIVLHDEIGDSAVIIGPDPELYVEDHEGHRRRALALWLRGRPREFTLVIGHAPGSR